MPDFSSLIFNNKKQINARMDEWNNKSENFVGYDYEIEEVNIFYTVLCRVRSRESVRLEKRETIMQ